MSLYEIFNKVLTHILNAIISFIIMIIYFQTCDIEIIKQQKTLNKIKCQKIKFIISLYVTAAAAEIYAFNLFLFLHFSSYTLTMIKIAFDFIFKPQLFIPTKIVNSFEQLIDISHSPKPELIIFDKDDTLTPLYSFTITNKKILHTIDRFRACNIKLFVLSNSIKLGDPLQIGEIEILKTIQKKPYNQQQVRKIIGQIQLSKVWIVGDRLMTDVYLANKLGCNSVLVPPIQQTSLKKHSLPVFALRKVEQLFLKIYWKE